MIESQIKTLKENIDSLLIDRGRVTDDLLDLRLAADGLQDLIKEIDAHLADVPGVTVVEAEWWTDTLDQLLEAAQRVPAAG